MSSSGTDALVHALRVATVPAMAVRQLFEDIARSATPAPGRRRHYSTWSSSRSAIKAAKAQGPTPSYDLGRPVRLPADYDAVAEGMPRSFIWTIRLFPRCLYLLGDQYMAVAPLDDGPLSVLKGLRPRAGPPTIRQRLGSPAPTIHRIDREAFEMTG